LALTAIIFTCGLAAQPPQIKLKDPYNVFKNQLNPAAPAPKLGAPPQPPQPIQPPHIKLRDPYNVFKNQLNPAAPAPKLGTPPQPPQPQQPPPFDPWDLLKLVFPDPGYDPTAGQPGSYSHGVIDPPKPPEPTADQIAQLTDEQLRTLLRGAADCLGAELDGLKTGEGWKKHLQLAMLQETLSDDAIGDALGLGAPGSIHVGLPERLPMDPDTRERLEKLSICFLEVAAEPKYKKIADLRGFRTLQRGLREYSLPPAERQAHVLSASLPMLINSLDRQRTGAGWKTYLRTQEIKQIAGSSEAWSQGDLDSVTEVLGQFEKVRMNPQYAVVAEMPGFEATYGALRAFVEALEEELVGSLPLPPPPVPLPPPPSD